MEPQAFNDWDLTVLTPLPSAVLVAAAAVLVGALALSTSTTKGAPLQLRGTLLALRLVLSVAVFVVLLEPGRRLLATSREPDRVVVAVDVSGSMAVGEGSAKRSVAAARAAKDVVDDVVARGYVADVRVFDGDVRKSSPEELAALAQGQSPAGKETRLTPVIDAIAAEENAAPLGGVVIVSDGGDTSGLLPGLSVDVREKLAALGAPLQAPVHTVVVGADANFKDVVVDRVAADEFAFVRNPLKVEVVLRQRGFAGQRVPVTLAEDGVIVARSEALFGGKDGDEGADVRVALEHTPQRAGKHLYTVQAPVLDGEAIAENNRLDFTVKLIRDRIRVLQVAGRPSWDERFVRRLLKENPSVDLISFFILRSTTDISGASNSEMSLIPFPTKELFTEQLSTFDVVIFQDFNYRPYNMGIYLRNVAEYVKGGGGFLMIGGDLTFAEGDYQPTELAEVLPITMRPGRGHLDTESFTPLVTEAGKAHPITDVASALSSTDVSIAALPQLQGLNLSAGLAPDAVALLTHPMQNADDGSPQPVIAVRDVEKGRAAALMTDSFWHWALPHVGNGGASGTATGDAHRKLLANTLRWLIRDPELSHVKLTLETRGAQRSRGVEPGSEVAAIVRTFDARYQPQGGAKVRLTLAPLDVGAGGTTKTIDGETGPDGTFRVPFVPDATGAWRVRVEVAADGRGAGVDEDVFVVSAASLERLYAEARPDLLKALAGASGGRAVEPGEVSGLPFVDHQKVRVHRQKTEPLWNTAVALVVVVGLAAAEWYWRRRRGFA